MQCRQKSTVIQKCSRTGYEAKSKRNSIKRGLLQKRTGGAKIGVTIKEIAKICGVSRMTVTRALQGVGSIRPETKQMILDKAAELGYTPNLVARSLVKGRSGMIGVVVVDLRNVFFSGIVDSISQYAKSRGYMVTVCTHQDDKEAEEKMIRTLTGYHVDGLILNCINKNEAFEDMLLSLGIPYVLLGYKVMARSHTVGIDDYSSGRAAVRYIAEHGYREMVFVSPALYDADGEPNIGHRDRWAGAKAGARESGVSCELIADADYVEQVLAYMEKRRKTKPLFLCSGDIFAGELMRSLKKAGYRNPDDYGVMGYDKIDFYQTMMDRPLTTVDNNWTQCGYQAAKNLIDLIEGNETEKDTAVPYYLVDGQTI